LTHGDVIQSEMDAHWAWEELRRHSERLAAFLEEPPPSLTAEDRRIVAVMARLILDAMWNSHAGTGDLNRLRAIQGDGEESMLALAERVARILEEARQQSPQP
jgi:hypothetical protein